MYILNKGEKNMSTSTTTTAKKVFHSASNPIKFVSKKTFYKHNKPNTNQQYMLVYPPVPYTVRKYYQQYAVYSPPAPYLLVTTLQNYRKAVQSSQTSIHPIVAAPTHHVNLYKTFSRIMSLPYQHSNSYTVALVPQSKQKRFYKTHTLNNNVKYL